MNMARSNQYIGEERETEQDWPGCVFLPPSFRFVPRLVRPPAGTGATKWSSAHHSRRSRSLIKAIWSWVFDSVLGRLHHPPHRYRIVSTVYTNCRRDDNHGRTARTCLQIGCIFGSNIFAASRSFRMYHHANGIQFCQSCASADETRSTILQGIPSSDM